MIDLAPPREDRGAMVSGSPALIGDHPLMVMLRNEIARAAREPAPVVIEGPTGVGKELCARGLHDGSGRAGRLVAVNVAALPESLQDAELFGTERGAYTGATSRPGLLEQASKGTLFLDEAAELTLPAQAKLLRALEEGQVRRVGGTIERRAAFRLVLTVQQPPATMLAAGRWREDFYYRVAGLVLRVPPLVERISDLKPLGDHFLAALGRSGLSPAMERVLAAHRWPGNVRELRRVLERACFLAGTDTLTDAHCRRALVAVALERDVARAPASRTLAEVDREYICHVLHQVGGRTSDAAKVLGLSLGQLYRRLTALGIGPRRNVM